MDIFAFHKENYFFEIERKDKLNSSLTFPVGIIALMVGAISVMAKAISLPPSDNQKVLVIFLLLAGICLVLSCYYLVRTYWGHPYSYMPYSSELLDYRKELYDFYISSGKPPQDAGDAADNGLDVYVEGQYAADASFNAKTNNTKSAILFKANAFIIASLALIVLAAPSYLYQQITAPTVIYRVQLAPEDHAMTNETDQKPAEKPQHQQAPAAPVMPTPPPSRLIKEHVEKPDRK